MKKILAVFSLLALLCILTGCGARMTDDSVSEIQKIITYAEAHAGEPPQSDGIVYVVDETLAVTTSSAADGYTKLRGLYTGPMLNGVPYGRGVFRHVGAINPDPRAAEWLYIGDFDHGTFHGKGRSYNKGREEHIGQFSYGDIVGIESSLSRFLIIAVCIVAGLMLLLIFRKFGKSHKKSKILKEIENLRITNPEEYRLTYGSYEDSEKLVLRSGFLPPPAQNAEAIINKTARTITLTFAAPLDVSYTVPVSQVKRTELLTENGKHIITIHVTAGRFESFSLGFTDKESLETAQKMKAFITSAAVDAKAPAPSSGAVPAQLRCESCGAILDYDDLSGNFIECKYCRVKTRIV